MAFPAVAKLWPSVGFSSTASQAMLRRCRTGSCTMMHTAKVVFMPQPRTLASSTTSHSFHFSPSTNVRPSRPMCTMTTDSDPPLEKLFEEKRSLRSKMRRELKKMDPIQRSQEDDAIQRIVLEAPWFKTSRSICAYISCDALREVNTSRIVSEILSNPATEGHVQIMKKLYLPRVEDKNSNMKMLKVWHLTDLEDGWAEVEVALSYSVQLLESERIAITPNDVPVDGLVSPSGFILVNQVAFEKCH